MSEDIFVPTSSGENALVRQLHTITLVTADAGGIDNILSAGLGLTHSDWTAPSAEARRTWGRYFGLGDDEDWELRAYTRQGEAANIQIRVLIVSDTHPQIRPEVSGRYLGGLSVGFPMQDLSSWETKMAKIGVKSSIGVKQLAFKSPNGDSYVSGEIHFLGPENLFFLGVQRPGIFIPVGPMDDGAHLGGPAYSARCIAKTDEVTAFFRKVLGFELRRDLTLTVAKPSGLRMREGQPERFLQAFAPGTRTGYLVFLDHHDLNQPSPAPSYGPPNRGLAMWSFETTDLDEVHSRAIASGCKILQPPQADASPFLAGKRSMLLEDPEGFQIEIFAS